MSLLSLYKKAIVISKRQSTDELVEQLARASIVTNRQTILGLIMAWGICSPLACSQIYETAPRTFWLLTLGVTCVALVGYGIWFASVRRKCDLLELAIFLHRDSSGMETHRLLGPPSEDAQRVDRLDTDDESVHLPDIPRRKGELLH